MKKKNKACQSCGMPLSRDPQGGGTNADGTKSEIYCGYCYSDGVLAGEGLSVNEFQDFCRKKMIESGHNRFIAWLFTRGYKRLDRWKKQS